MPRDLQERPVYQTFGLSVGFIQEGMPTADRQQAYACDPLTEFHKAIAPIFREMQARLNDSMLETLRTVEITESGIDLAKAGLKTPAATWTYIIHDTPLGDRSQRLCRSVKRKLRHRRSPGRAK